METQKYDEINFADHDNIKKMQWNMSEAILLIETFIKENKSLNEIKLYFFGSDKRKIKNFDILFTENVYEEKFLSLLPEKVQQHITKMFEDQQWEEVKIWFDGIYLEKYSVWECLERTKPPSFFDAIEFIDKSKLAPFFNKMFGYFQSTFLEIKFSNLQYALFQTLIKCDANTALSQLFIESLQKLENKFNADSVKACLFPETNIVHKEHQIFADLVDSFDLKEHDLVSLKLLIKKLYNNSTTILRENGDKVFEIIGRQIVWSNVSKNFGTIYDENSISQLRLTARHLLVLDEDVKLNGKNLALVAPKIVIQTSVICDLSGAGAVEMESKKAENGTEENKNGQNGKNGTDGESSGSMVICASEIVNFSNLQILMNGGQGSNGQDGGNGFDGSNGIGKKFKKAFGFGTKFKLKTAAIGNVILGGLPGILRARYKETIKGNEIKRLKTFSTHKWPSHAMVVYKGTKGSPGGRGGLSGDGGYGGKKGNLTLMNLSISKEDIKIDSNDGKDGETGNHGKNGIDGQDGWDIACIKKSFGKLRKYGKFNNEKLEIIFTNKEDKETVYIKSKDTGAGSHCYAKIIAKPLKNLMLKDNEEEATKKMERMKTKSKEINVNSVEKTFQKLFNLTSKDKKMDRFMEVTRIAERYEPAIYVPKHEIKPSDAPKDTFKEKEMLLKKNLEEFYYKHDSEEIIDKIGLIKPTIDKLLKFVNGKMLYPCLELIYIENYSIGTDFVIALLAVFEVDGCRIDCGTLKYFVECVFFAVKKNKTYKFSSILLSKDQSEWVDEFLLCIVEMIINLPMDEKEMIQKSLKNVLDDNLKFLCARWFRRYPVDSKQLVAAVKEIENVIVPISVVDKNFFTEWPKVLKYSKINSNLSIKDDDSEDIKLIKFWCIKLSSYFSYEEVEKTFEILSAQKGILSDKENISRLVHRLCIYDFVAGDFNPREDPIVTYLINEVFACFFEISPSSPSETYIVANEVVEQFKTEISNTEVTSNCLEKVWEKCCKNVPVLFEIDSVSDSFCNELFKKFKESGENWDMEEFQNQIAETQKWNLKDFDICLVKFVAKVIDYKFNIELRINQKIAILTAIRGRYPKGILQQLPTGDGKSFIIVVTSIILIWKRRTVNVITSSSVLAKRDALQYMEYYKIFGIKVSHICDESPYVRAERYETNHVLYGDLSSFQRDYLLDTFYSMKITNNRPCDIVIVDEVDSMLLDQGSNMLYLSHEIPDMERLQSLFVKIWQTVHITKTQMADDDDLYIFIYHSCFPSISMLNMVEILQITEYEVHVLKTRLIQNGIINRDEDILIMECDEIDSKFEKLSELSLSTIEILKYLFHHLIKQERLCIPTHLHKFVKCHLKEFIENAKLAMYMEEGIQYLVDMNSSNASLRYEPRIIIIDQNTGADMPSTQWSNGLQQFLQLKHGLRLTPISLKAVYISSVSYFKIFKQILGFSGTLGSGRERQHLYEKYKVDLLIVPSTLPRLFYEEPSIITTMKKDGNNDSHVNEIFNAINTKLIDNRSVLIICESIKQVDELSLGVKNLAEKEFSGESLLPYINATLYCRDYEKFKYAEGIKLPCKTIIFSTNLAGRGTNILLTEELQNAGGLHVIVAFLPKNLRIEEQAFGRAARAGDSGSGQLIICIDENKQSIDFHRLQLQRNAQDNHRIEIEYDYYDDIVEVEETCLEKFAKHFHEHKTKMDEKNVEEFEKTFILRDLLDQWALWMDTYPNEICSPLQRRNASEKSYTAMKNVSLRNTEKVLSSLIAEPDPIKFKAELSKFENERIDSLEKCKFKNLISEGRYAAAEVFCNKLSTKITQLDKDCLLTQPSNILMFATNQIEKKNYYEAEKNLKWLASNHPIYEPEAKYYLTFLSVKKYGNLTHEKNKEYEQLAKNIKESRSEYDRRMFSNFIDRAIIEFYKESDTNKIFKADIFSQQQIEQSQIASLFIESIDALIGGRLDTKSFMTSYIPEEASYLLYQHFMDDKNFDKLPIKPIKVCDDYDIQKLKEYSQKHDIGYDTLHAKIESLRGKDVCEKDLIDAANLPTLEDFWEILAANNVLVNQQQHFFANLIKFETMDPALVDIIKNLIKEEPTKIVERLFKHYYILDENWKEIDVSKMKEKLQPEFIDLLCDMEVFCETVSAEVKLKPFCNINFNSFNKLTTDNLMTYNIPESNTNNILYSLTNNEIIKAVDNNTFELSDNYISSMEEQKIDIQPCFNVAIWKAINKNLAFQIAYQKLQQDLKEMKQLKIMLPLASDYSIIFDLIDYEILERSNVDFTALKSITNAKKPFTKNVKAIYQNAIISDASSVNIEIAAESVKTKCRNNLKPLNTVVEESNTKEYEYITSENNKIYQIFIENTCAQERFETLNAELCLLWDVLTECNLIEMRNTLLAFKNCIKYIIKFNEKRWSRKTLTKLGLISIAAGVQVAIATIIMFSTAGLGAPISKYFISQGFGDIIYILKSCYTGYAENYIQHKLISMMMGAIPNLTWIKELITATQTIPTTLSINTVGNLVISKLRSQILSISINLSIQTIFHSKVDQGIEYVAESTQKLINEILEKEMTNMNQIFQSIFEKMDLDITKQFTENYIIEYFLPKIGLIITTICDFIFIQYRNVFIKFEPNMADNDAGKKDSSLFDKIKAISVFILQKSELSSLCSKMGHIIRISLNDLETAVQTGCGDADDDKSCNKHSSVEINSVANALTENFKSQVEKIIEKTVTSKITAPLVALTMSKLQKNLDNKVTQRFEELKNNFQNENLLPKNLYFQQHRINIIAEKDKQNIGHLFEDMLNDLMKTTKNSITYVHIIMAGMGIDEMACRYLAMVITTKLPMHLVIKYSNDENFTYSNDDKNVEIIQLNLTDEILGTAIQPNRLFDAIRNQIPMLPFKDKQEFKESFIEVIKNDPDFEYNREMQISMADTPMTTEDLISLLNNQSESSSMLSGIMTTPANSNVLFLE